jgi:periplasmic divalent cation tolerance protein
MTGILFLYVTCANTDEARIIAKRAVEAHLAACGNIFPAMRSVYRWEGKLQESEEAVLILKTTALLRDALEKLVLENHSYDTPCVAALDVSHMNETYRMWLESETKA